ncbi:flagellar hook-length control protein FliK [Fusibacter bizertensis]|uniref:Flagellar hook-length control protein FliK n=1 Tax=Fusibacter bizertensis TaxID=1488331 RepID=A0ABT6N886_9FIRM|nr:flagellar hook-length control protein FliK [Fusibacter bizertensis]MDH8676629.1 flagellar hook-length control protein FliK [Fusibacter bizertensis]
MQLRELLNNKQALNPLIEIKNVAQNSSVDVFNQILTRKNESITKPDVKSSSYSDRSLNTKNEYEKKDNQFSLKSIASEVNNAGKKQSDIGVSKSSNENNDVYDDDKFQNKPSQKIEKASKNAEKDDVKSDLTEKLKQKLKKETGMNDEQLDQLLASLNLDVTGLQKLLDGGPELGEMLKTMGDILDSLEIDSALGQNLSSKDISQIVKQLNQVIETLDKIATKEVDQDKSESKSFESQLIQKISQVVSTLEATDTSTEVMPQELSQTLLSAISTNETNSKLTETVEQPDLEVSTGAKMNASIVETTTSNNTDSNDSDSKSENNQSQNKVNQSNVVSESVVSQNVATKPTQSVVTDSVPVETEVKVVEDSNGVSLHQVTMKNGNSVTTQTVAVTPALKQEVVSQLMEAIKGQIKLSDQGTSMIVKLQPEQLGNVELKLNIQKGVVLAELKVENEIVKAAIESNLDDLKQSLSNKGYAVDQINVSVDSGKKEGQEAFDFQGRGKDQQKKNGNRLEGNLDIEPLEQISRYELNELEGSTFSYYG